MCDRRGVSAVAVEASIGFGGLSRVVVSWESDGRDDHNDPIVVVIAGGDREFLSVVLGSWRVGVVWWIFRGVIRW